MTRSWLAGAAPDAARLDASISPRALGVAGFASGMGALLGLCLERGEIAARADSAAVLAEHLTHGRARALLLHQALSRVLAALRARKIEAAVLKGMHTGPVYFPEPGTRPGADVDLLVGPDDFAPACEVLAGMGFRQGTVSLDGPRIEWLPPDSDQVPHTLEMEHERNPWAVDLHGSLDRVARFGVRSRFGSPAPTSGDTLELGGHTLYVLQQPLLLAWLAAHTAMHLETSPLVRYLELVLVIRRDLAPHPVLWGHLLQLVEAAAVGRLVYPAFELAEKLAPGSVPIGVRNELRRFTTPLMRRVVARVEPERAQQMYGLGPQLWLMWAASPCQLLALVTGSQGPGGNPLRVLTRRLGILCRRALFPPP